MSEIEEKNYQLVKVYVRQRPFTKNEIELRKSNIIYKLCPDEITLKMGLSEKKYVFDQVFGAAASQAEIYEIVVSPLINYIIAGYNCTVFAYGQTGTGKTHTMIGSDIGPNTDFNNDASIGMIPRAASHLFSQLNKLSGKIEYTVNVSFIEIYNEEVRDLLVHDSGPLKIYDDPENKGSICIKGLTEKTVCNTDEVYEWLTVGTRERQTAQTNLNRHSSRSHTIFTLLIHTSETTAEGEEIIKTGKLHLTDLAGSENIGKSGAVDMRAREAGTINKSLLTLGKVIKALAQKQHHIPYRDSKLTRILQDSLGGNTKTCMVATFSPCADAWDETVSALDYAHVARSVANCPHVNVNRKQVTVVKDLKNHMFKLRQELQAARTGDGFYMTNESYNEMTSEIVRENERIVHLVKEIQHLEEYTRLKEEQFKEINDSFAKTKSYLNNIQEELKKEKLKEKQNEYILKYIDGRAQELDAATELLENVCKTSTKHEQIYHKKYQAQCTSTVNNANIAGTLCSTALRCVKEIEDSTECYGKNQDSYITAIRETAGFFNNVNLINLGTFNDFLSALQAHAIKFALSFDKILNNDGSEYTDNNIPEKIGAILNCNNLAELERQKELENSIGMLKHNVVSKNAELESKAINCLKLIEDECEKEHEYFVVMGKLIQDLHRSNSERYNNIQEQISRNNDYIKVLEEFLLMKEQEEEYLVNELESVKKLSEEVPFVLSKYEDNTFLLSAKQELMSIKECQQENMKTHLSMFAKTVGIVENNEKCREEQIASDKGKLRQYFSGFITTITDNLQYYNTVIKNSLSDLISQAHTSTKNISQSTSEYSKNIEEITEDVLNLTRTHNSDLKQFIQHSSERIQDYNKNVAHTAHNGDTPVKLQYDFPKKIVNRIPHEVLVEKFLNSSASNIDSP